MLRPIALTTVGRIEGKAMAFSSYDVLDSCDLTLLRGVLEDVCAENKLSMMHPAAETIAHELVNWYLFGVKCPQKLKTMLKPL